MNAKGYYYQYSKNEYVASELKYFKVLLDEVENSDVMRIAEFPDGHRHELTLAQVQSLGSNPIGWVGKQVQKKKRTCRPIIHSACSLGYHRVCHAGACSEEIRRLEWTGFC